MVSMRVDVQTNSGAGLVPYLESAVLGEIARSWLVDLDSDTYRQFFNLNIPFQVCRTRSMSCS